MLYLILAILSSAGVSLVMRLSIRSVKNNITMLSVGYLSCTLLAALHTLSGGAALSGSGLGLTVILSALAGSLLLAGFIALQYNIRINGVVLAGIFSRLGVLVPTTLSVLLFGERPRLVQTLGFLLALLAIVLVQFDRSGGRADSKPALLALLLACGFADAMSKIYEEFGSRPLQELYLLLSFLIAFALSAALALSKKQGLSAGDVGYGLLLGIPNYYSARFLIKALADIPAVVAYPTYSVAVIVVISLLGLLVFREKLSGRQKAAMLVILAALALLNL